MGETNGASPGGGALEMGAASRTAAARSGARDGGATAAMDTQAQHLQVARLPTAIVTCTTRLTAATALATASVSPAIRNTLGDGALPALHGPKLSVAPVSCRIDLMREPPLPISRPTSDSGTSRLCSAAASASAPPSALAGAPTPSCRPSCRPVHSPRWRDGSRSRSSTSRSSRQATASASASGWCALDWKPAHASGGSMLSTSTRSDGQAPLPKVYTACVSISLRRSIGPCTCKARRSLARLCPTRKAFGCSADVMHSCSAGSDIIICCCLASTSCAYGSPVIENLSSHSASHVAQPGSMAEGSTSVETRTLFCGSHPAQKSTLSTAALTGTLTPSFLRSIISTSIETRRRDGGDGSAAETRTKCHALLASGGASCSSGSRSRAVRGLAPVMAESAPISTAAPM
mmetsp:Transcript_10916/g.25318  ORF Transcript_10916/g.25318 Transcript_10916/m.25318 type:complete len:405 (-) Transcript_10916:92-1306(-)